MILHIPKFCLPACQPACLPACLLTSLSYQMTGHLSYFLNTRVECCWHSCHILKSMEDNSFGWSVFHKVPRFLHALSFLGEKRKIKHLPCYLKQFSCRTTTQAFSCHDPFHNPYSILWIYRDAFSYPAFSHKPSNVLSSQASLLTLLSILVPFLLFLTQKCLLT